MSISPGVLPFEGTTAAVELATSGSRRRLNHHLCAEAETLQQRAERRRGADAVGAYEQAAVSPRQAPRVRLRSVSAPELLLQLLPGLSPSLSLASAAQAKFQQALQLAGSGGGASADDVIEAHFGLVRFDACPVPGARWILQLAGGAVPVWRPAATAQRPAAPAAPAALQGECLQNWGEAVLEVCGALPDAELSPVREQQAGAQAAQLFQQAVQAYKRVGRARQVLLRFAICLLMRRS